MIITAAFSVAISAFPAAATSVLDQSNTTPDDLLSIINEGCTYVAQTFTAGVSGSLTGVNIDVRSTPDAHPLRVVIRDARNDRPLGSPLGIRNMRRPQAPLSRLIVFHEEIPVVAGQHYAIQVSYRAAGVGPGVFLGRGDWHGGSGNQYLDGRSLSGDCSFGDTGFWHVMPISDDLHFRTYVEPAPRP
jgi:hypothetical protein